MAPLALILAIVLIVLAAMYYMSSKGSSSCGCNNKRDPVYLDDPATNLNTPDQYRDEFLDSRMSKLV
jgi:hypothetical protein